MNEAARDLFSRIIDAYYAMDPLFRPYTHWVMDDEWFTAIKDMRDSNGDKLWDERTVDCRVMMGKPFEVRPGAGFPHLEVDPVEVPPALSRIA